MREREGEERLRKMVEGRREGQEKDEGEERLRKMGEGRREKDEGEERGGGEEKGQE